jgi:DNA-binding transcriptional ArsR family regulator
MEWLSHPTTIGGVALAAKSKTSKGRSKRKNKTKRARGVDQRLVKALAHELRVEILTILNERMASPNELSKELDEGLSQVSYHVKVLKDYECIELIKTEPRRGAVEHYYRATSRPFVSDRDWLVLPSTVRAGLSAELLELIQGDAINALVEGTFEAREDVHLTRTLMLLDERGWNDLMAALSKTLERVSKIQTECAARLQKSGDEGINASVSMLGFELPEMPSERGKAKAKGKAKATGKAKGKAKAKAKR